MKEKIPKSKILVLASIVAVTFVVSILLIQNGEAEIVAYDGPPKAAIIDQLYDEIPNEKFHQKATEYLEAAGYEVDTFTTKDVTVDFYKNLPTMNYKLVVIRTHGTETNSGDDVVLFTGERYTEDKYITEQLLGQVKKATPLLEIIYRANDNSSSEWIIVNDTYRYLKSPADQSERAQNEFFAISPKLVESMNGKFQDTIFILGGCDTMSNPSMSKALIEKGGSEVFGWDDTVGSTDNDNFILFFLRFYLDEGYTIDQTMEKIQKYQENLIMPYPANFINYNSLIK